MLRLRQTAPAHLGLDTEGRDRLRSHSHRRHLGGPAPYWTDWSIDKIGNRTTEISHAAAGNTTRSFAVPAAGLNVVRPHAVTSTTTTVPGQTTGAKVSYDYDNTGNMTTRPGATNGQEIRRTVSGATATLTGTRYYDSSLALSWPESESDAP